MGSSTSKPTSNPSVFHGETPVRFGSSLVSTLQTTSETDHTRAQSLELHVQSRIADELTRLETRESELLGELDGRISEAEDKGRGREEVQHGIESLKERVAGLPKLRELDGGLEEARGRVLECLKGKGGEGRSLDCWAEVEGFKREARRWEKEFVVRTVGREY